MPSALVRTSIADAGGFLVGEQLHAGGTRGHSRDDADETVRVDHGVVHADAEVGTGRDDNGLVERAAGAGDDLGSDVVVVLREARPVDVREQAPERLGLLLRELGLDRALPELAVLGAEAFGLAAGVEEAVGPAVRVAERLRHALEADGERAQSGRSGGLDTGERAVVAAAERERDEDEREEDEAADDDPAAQHAGAAVAEGGRRDAPDGHAQRRRTSAASSGHDSRV